MLEHIKNHTIPYEKSSDLDHIIESIGDAKYVLLGEASHGTSEFYTVRADLTKKLIQEKNFNCIAVEGDWPACQKVNNYIKGYEDATNVNQVLSEFNRWPTWMWANEEVKALVKWLKEFNKKKEKGIGFYGIDVYSLWESMEEIIAYLRRIQSPDLEFAKRAFACFEPHGQKADQYAVAASLFSEDCIREVSQLLQSIQLHKHQYSHDQEQSLNLEMNALVAVHAENYYRMMMTDDKESWNVRDSHMVEALNTIKEFHGNETKIVVWEHNTHVGDARATDMASAGMVNVGQLLRENNKEDEVYIVGFGTHRGSVIASTKWGEPLESMNVPLAKADSWEDLMHQAKPANQILIFNNGNRDLFNKQVGHRAIGVVYNPEYEHYGNYVPSRISERYDAFIHIDKTHALKPLNLERLLV